MMELYMAYAITKISIELTESPVPHPGAGHPRQHQRLTATVFDFGKPFEN